MVLSETDILGGAQLGFKTILVLTGGTRHEHLTRYAYQPHKVVDSIADLNQAELLREFANTGSPDGDLLHPHGSPAIELIGVSS
jgi:NagD protein